MAKATIDVIVDAELVKNLRAMMRRVEELEDCIARARRLCRHDLFAGEQIDARRRGCIDSQLAVSGVEPKEDN